jgi:zinc ribbon protein
MATVFCDNCGTSLLDSAKFCRACGKPTPSASEATTRKFEEQPGVQSPTRSVGPSFTAPAYMSPMEFNPSAPGVATNDLRQKTRNRNLIIVACMFGVMILALAGLLMFLRFGISATQSPPPVVELPKVPPPPGPPPNLPNPPNPPGAPGANAPSGIDPSLIYPGSRETMSVVKDGGKSVLQLTSDDSASTVADWYSARLKPTKTVHIIGQTILKAGDIGVVIMGGESGSQILITKGED